MHALKRPISVKIAAISWMSRDASPAVRDRSKDEDARSIAMPTPFRGWRSPAANSPRLHGMLTCSTAATPIRKSHYSRRRAAQKPEIQRLRVARRSSLYASPDFTFIVCILNSIRCRMTSQPLGALAMQMRQHLNPKPATRAA